MDFQESVTKVHVLYLSLYDQYLSFRIPLFAEDQKNAMTDFGILLTLQTGITAL